MWCEWIPEVCPRIQRSDGDCALRHITCAVQPVTRFTGEFEPSLYWRSVGNSLRIWDHNPDFDASCVIRLDLTARSLPISFSFEPTSRLLALVTTWNIWGVISKLHNDVMYARINKFKSLRKFKRLECFLFFYRVKPTKLIQQIPWSKVDMIEGLRLFHDMEMVGRRNKRKNAEISS